MKLSFGLVNLPTNLPIVVWLILSGFLLVSTTPVPDNTSLVIRQIDVVPSSLIDDFRLVARFASAAYCDLDGWNCGAVCEGLTEGTELVRFIRVEGAFPSRGYVAINHRLRAIIAAFRGTSDLESFFYDLKFIQVPFKTVNGAKIHRGLDIVHRTSAAQFTPLVIELAKKYPDYRIITTGHSLGGTTALLEALDLVHLGIGKDRLRVYVYGMLRVGNEEFAEYVNSLVDQGYGIYRIVRTNDFAPHVPPRVVGYKHNRPEYWITKSGEVVKCLEAEDPMCANSVLPNVSVLTHWSYFNTPMSVTCALLHD